MIENERVVASTMAESWRQLVDLHRKDARDFGILMACCAVLVAWFGLAFWQDPEWLTAAGHAAVYCVASILLYDWCARRRRLAKQAAAEARTFEVLLNAVASAPVRD